MLERGTLQARSPSPCDTRPLGKQSGQRNTTRKDDHDFDQENRSHRWCAVPDPTVAFIIADHLITGVLKRPNYLTGVPADANTLIVGGLFAVVSGVAVVAISVLLFPLLKPTSEPPGLGYVCERVIELVLQLLFFLMVPLLMVAIGNGLRDGTIAASTSASLRSEEHT